MTELKDRTQKALKIFDEYVLSPRESGKRFTAWHELKDNAVEMGHLIKDQQSRIQELEDWDKIRKPITGEEQAAFMANWLRGEIIVPEQVKLRIRSDLLERVSELETAIRNHLEFPLMGSKELKEVLGK